MTGTLMATKKTQLKMTISHPFHSWKLPTFLCPKTRTSLLGSVHQWLEAMEIHNPKVARLLCRSIPAHCPFEQDIKLFGHTLFYIPPLCQLNPFYEQVVSLRFRALSYLADECGEDIAPYL